MTPIQKAKEIAAVIYTNIIEYGRQAMPPDWKEYSETTEGKALIGSVLSGEDWKESQWEYKVRPSLVDWDLTDMGKQGWQLCAVNDKYYYFKRPFPNPLNLRTMKEKIISTHIEPDIVNGSPTLVFASESGKEYVLEQDGGQWMKLTEKSKSWYFDEKNKKK